MHEGPLAEGLAADIQRLGGLVTAADLVAAQPQVKPAMRAHVYGVEVGTPSSTLRMQLVTSSGEPQELFGTSALTACVSQDLG